jgi:glycosyltransferase involved in cell wall biosynthesis
MALTTGPLVTIMTPVYDGSEYLDELIQSVLKQDYPHIEHLIIDDGSQDDGATVAILKQYPQLRWWSRANKGQYATMNEGLQTAEGEIICFVSADDVLVPGAVSAVVEFLSKHSHDDGVFGITTRIDPAGESLPFYIPFRTAPMAFYPYFAHISHCSLYVKTASLRKHELQFDSTLKYVGDYDWMIRIYKSGLKVGLLKQELSRVRLHPDQASRKFAGGSQLEEQKVLDSQQIDTLAYRFFHWIYWASIKTRRDIQYIKENGMVTAIGSRIRKSISRWLA